MKLKKTPNALDTDELLSLLENTPAAEKATEEPVIEYKNNVVEFLSVFNIQPGDTKIKTNTLYSIYKVWCEEPISKVKFTIEAGKYLATGKLSSSSAFLINQNAIKLTHYAYNKFKEEKQIDRTKSKKWMKHFEDFTLFYSITPGEFWIHSQILYFIYDKYAHERKLDYQPQSYLSEDSFNRMAKLVFKNKRTKFGRLYAISENIQNFFQEGQLQRMKDNYVQKKKPKKSNRKSRTKPQIQS